MRWFWIDRFTEFVSGSHAVAVKGVSLAEVHVHEYQPGYAMHPNALVIEGIAQAGGLLISEHYGFGELVVLAKLSKAKFNGWARAGETLTYRVKADWIRADSAQVSGVASVGDRPHGEVQLLFARMGEEMAQQMGVRLFRPSDLRHWLDLVRIFEVGVKQDGMRLKRSDYPLDENPSPVGPAAGN
jgi:3-hydroxyacyl-[acyl-carrier-protein] dehydratase